MSACPAQTALCSAVMPSSLGALGSSTCKTQSESRPEPGPTATASDYCHMIKQEENHSSASLEGGSVLDQNPGPSQTTPTDAPGGLGGTWSGLGQNSGRGCRKRRSHLLTTLIG